MTEDMLQEHAEVLSQLGTTQEGARVRAQMQSASLLSDMEAFKVWLSTERNTMAACQGTDFRLGSGDVVID